MKQSKAKAGLWRCVVCGRRTSRAWSLPALGGGRICCTCDREIERRPIRIGFQQDRGKDSGERSELIATDFDQSKGMEVVIEEIERALGTP